MGDESCPKMKFTSSKNKEIIPTECLEISVILSTKQGPSFKTIKYLMPHF